MSKYGYVSSEVIISKYIRDIKNGEVDEGDIIEWIGEAMGFMKNVSIQEEALAFIEVKDYTAAKPCGLQTIIQVARDNDFDKQDCYINPQTTFQGVEVPCSIYNGVPTDCQGNLIGEYEVAYYRPYFDLRYEYEGWINSRMYKDRFTPIRLSNHSFFKTIVAKENTQGLYKGVRDEYTLKGEYPNVNMTFSFEKGSVVVSYLRNAVEPGTGYPLIPDDISFITAVSYYIRWKIADSLAWNGREGFYNIALQNEERWLRYVRQANNKAKMPHGVEDYQDLMKQSLYLIPNLNKAEQFFGNVSDINYGRRR